MNSDTVSSIYFRLRQLCSLDIEKQTLKLGGVGKIIESLYAKVKHSKGKDLSRPQVWCFGMVQRKDSTTNGKCYMEVVPNRESENLLEIIYDKCLTGSTIYSDCWSSYQKLTKLKEFKHMTVNHSYNFLDPDTGACTNRIESLWNSSKNVFKDMRGSKFYKPGENFENIDKMFLESNGDPPKDAVLNFSEINDDDDTEESDSQIEKDKSHDEQTDQTESLTIQEKNLGSNISIETTSDLELDDEDLEALSERSLEKPVTSTEAKLQVKKALSKHENPVRCPICNDLMKNERGVKLHMAKKHKLILDLKFIIMLRL
ncbi:unnamed protein product [Brachionus calyciflorus]|uniref:ISXO2-like transposase domain-containing protein n=1 Tax=Brachionus calyciflorus TaxID=104777 RepID=A0A813Z9X5_9BILA|nr:unnamed protein product [Brachionus calyciflorus]